MKIEITDKKFKLLAEVEYFYQWDYQKDKEIYNSLGNHSKNQTVGNLKSMHGQELHIFIDSPKFPTDKPYPFGY